MPATAEAQAKTRAFARVLGPFLIIVPGIIAMRAPEMGPYIPSFFGNPALVWITGALMLFGGLFVIAQHQYCIFISYRRDDSQNIADRIFDHLSRDFDRKKLFKDVDNIPIGTNFRDYLAKAVAKTDIMLAIIGPSWAAQGADGRRRLDDPNDFIALEVASALKLGRPVVPVLVGGAQMPRPDELPEPLKELSVINAVQVRPDPDFIKDYQRLSKALKAIATQSSGKVTPVRRVISRAAVFLANLAFGKVAVGKLKSSTLVNVIYYTKDQKSNYTGDIYAVYFRDTYEQGVLLEYMIFIREHDAKWRLSGLGSVPAPTD